MKPNITSRDKDFIEACQSVLSHCSCDSRPCMRAIVASAITSPAPSYYVSPDYAFRIMSSYLNHGKLPSRRLAREMWLEIASKSDTAEARKSIYAIDKSGYRGNRERACIAVLYLRRLCAAIASATQPQQPARTEAQPALMARRRKSVPPQSAPHPPHTTIRLTL